MQLCNAISLYQLWRDLKAGIELHVTSSPSPAEQPVKKCTNSVLPCTQGERDHSVTAHTHTHHAALPAEAQLHHNPHQPQRALINAWLIRGRGVCCGESKITTSFNSCFFFFVFLQISGKKRKHYFERIMTQVNTSTSVTVPFSAELQQLLANRRQMERRCVYSDCI